MRADSALECSAARAPRKRLEFAVHTLRLLLEAHTTLDTKQGSKSRTRV